MDSCAQQAFLEPETAIARHLPEALLCVVVLFGAHSVVWAETGAASVAPGEQVSALAHKIALLEQQLKALRDSQQALLEVFGASASHGSAAPEDPVNPGASVAAMPANLASGLGSEGDQKLTLFGDSRLRFESTSTYGEFPPRNRGVLRARLAAEYAFKDSFTLGARLATGDSDDPNSSDITLGNFVDDLEVSLDRAYVRYQGEDVLVLGGKFANPFLSRDLVWDADVNPQGVAVGGSLYADESQSLQLTAAFTPIDNQEMDDDSYMSGLQLAYRSVLDSDWSVQLSSAYYDYSIGSLANAGDGDIRDNRLTADGLAYLSDFDLLDTVALLRYHGLGSRVPVSLHADYVVNFGAYDEQDSAYEFGVKLGRSQLTGDWQFGYGYAEADIDAVLTAFSHDNTTFASNYRQHSLYLGYVPINDVLLSMTAYHYRRDRSQPGYPVDWDEWVTRLRFNLSFQF